MNWNGRPGDPGHVQPADLIYTVIDCGGRNTEAFRAVLTICDTLIAPWTTG